MSFLQIEIFALTLLSLGVFALFDPVRSWVLVVRRHPGISILIIMAFLGLFLTPDPTVVRGVSDIDRYRFLRIVLMTVLATVVWMLIMMRGFRVNKPGAGIWWMLLFSIIGMASYFYSVNPLLSLWKGFEMFAIGLLFLYVSSQVRDLNGVKNVLDIFSLIILFLVLSALVGALLAPGEALQIQRGGIGGAQAYAYVGVFPPLTPNTLAQIGAIIGIIGVVSLLYRSERHNRFAIIGLLVVGLFAMLMAHSRTSILGFILAILFMFAFGRRMLLGIALFVILGAVVIAIPKFYSYGEQYIVRGQTHDAFVTLSGRTNFWPNVLEAFWLSPVVGHGYYSGHRDLVVNGKKLLEYSSVDNTYLEVLVDLGVVGITILLSALVSVVRDLWIVRPSKVNKEYQLEWRPIWVTLSALLIILFIRSLTGPTFQVYHPNLILFLLLALCFHKARGFLINNRSGVRVLL